MRRPDAVLSDLAGRRGHRERLTVAPASRKWSTRGTVLPEDDVSSPGCRGAVSARTRRDLATGKSGHVVDVDDAVDHSERMDMSRAAVSSASPRAPSRAWASSVHPPSAKRTARGPEQAATGCRERRRRADLRARGSGCLLPWVKAQHGDQLDFGRTPTSSCHRVPERWRTAQRGARRRYVPKR